VNQIPDLKALIKRDHGVEVEHVESVPVKEVFKGKTVWEGIVEVFELKGHPTLSRIYGWSYQPDDPNESMHHVTVLHQHPIKSARDAVRAAIVQELRSLGTTEES
jgi:hypothetical protein